METNSSGLMFMWNVHVCISCLRMLRFAARCRLYFPVVLEAGSDRRKLIALLWNIKARLFKRNFLYLLKKTLNFPSACNKDAYLVYKTIS
jgi:hypothetical protein